MYKKFVNGFKNLDILVDWKRIEAINKYRNNIEHYYSSESHDSIRSLIPIASL